MGFDFIAGLNTGVFLYRRIIFKAYYFARRNFLKQDCLVYIGVILLYKRTKFPGVF